MGRPKPLKTASGDIVQERKKVGVSDFVTLFQQEEEIRKPVDIEAWLP